MARLKVRMNRLRRRLVFLAARSLMRRFGFENSRALGSFLGAWQYFLRVFARRRCMAHISAVLGARPRDPRVAALLRSAYRVSTTCALQVVSMVDRKLDADRLRELCRVDGIGNLAAARSGRGAILLATHSCNSLLLAAQLADQGWPISIVYRQSPMMSRQFLEEGLGHYGFHGIAANGGFRAYASMVDAMRHNRVLFAMMDDSVRRAESGVLLRFLGKDLPMPGGIVQLARQTRAPILPVTSLAVVPVWHFEIEPPLQLVSGGTIEEDVAKVLRHVERQILTHPELWSWPHRRWFKAPLAPGA
jgi:lauroyl/myristoyl acyltransferase